MAANNPGRAMHRDKPILLLSRPEADSQRFLTALPTDLVSFCHPIIAPVFRIFTLPVDRPMAGDIILTSSNALGSVPAAQGCRAWCIGQATTEKARQAGFDARFAGRAADDLVAYLGGFPPQKFTHFRGKHTRGDIAERLRAAGHDVGEAIVYEQIERAWQDRASQALFDASAIVAPVFSPRTGRIVSRRIGDPAKLYLAAMSESVALEFDNRDSNHTVIAAQPEWNGMLDATIRLLKLVSRVEGNPSAL